VTAAPALTARPMWQEFRGRVIVHAAANQQISSGMGYAPGEALCGSLAELAECEPGLFPPQITCRRCMAIAAAEDIEITGGQR
jgi:hypothetical protein